MKALLKYIFVRYFFENELTSFLNKSGFDVIKYEAFMGEKTLRRYRMGPLVWHLPVPYDSLFEFIAQIILIYIDGIRFH